MRFSTVVLSCSHCKYNIGSLNIDDISLLSAEQVIQLLINHRVTILCQSCSCDHEFSSDDIVKIRSTSGLDETLASRE